MIKDLKFWKFSRKILEKGAAAVLLLVAESAGSSPGRQGFKMIVNEQIIEGSIGGGVMELSLVRLARQILGESASRCRIIEQVHRHNLKNSSGMICSGKQTVILKKLTKKDLPTIEKIVKILEQKERGKLIVTENTLKIVRENNKENIFGLVKREENDFRYEEHLGYVNDLYLIGGGHCALALSEIMSKLGFRILLFDDRPNLNTIQKNGYTDQVTILDSYEKISNYVPSGENNYVVVMTLGYKFDETVIRRLLPKKFKYFGVMGSKAKMKALFKSLEKEGHSREKLARIYSPIGLPINSQTPEEIAVSIAAEIISVKNAEK